jgi:co-chaperonin GroES (HSP10)
METQIEAKNMSVESMEDQVKVLTEMLHAAHTRRFTPKYPWVFVRVVKKEQNYKGVVVLPDSDQNKINHEGIVLATWGSIIRYNGCLAYKIDSELKPGDRVLFPHWAGLPVVGFKDVHYRIVKETHWTSSQEGGIFATVEYPGREDSPSEKLRKIVGNVANPFRIDELVTAIEQQFLLVDRDEQSVTLSGR